MGVERAVCGFSCAETVDVEEVEWARGLVGVQVADDWLA